MTHITLPPRDRGIASDPVSPEATEAVVAWQRAVDAGLIGRAHESGTFVGSLGQRRPLSAEHLANLRRTEAILRGAVGATLARPCSGRPGGGWGETA